MEHQKTLPASERGMQVYRWRTTLGWDSAKVAKLLDVGPRTIGLWETGVQPMPDARWRLFVYEVINEVNRIPQMVVVVAEDEVTPIDVVSDANYAGLAIADDGQTALIASYAIDRQTNQPRLHRQLFRVAANKHVIRAAERWESERQVPDQDRAAYEMHRWMTRRVLQGELGNPRLIMLKQAINDAKAELDKAGDAPEDIRRERIDALDRAVGALIREVGEGKSQ
ncbi:hypothetical protein [Zoogloea sp. LCSB751]|jgi:DNA-binding XRE family transcriptional regulator|uniref:hypothetical protein n=1 Tax=Zoogloea sp. LCSB751 TaxID=1965277 RepID=UPI0009A4BDE1|nr:hypothetical protein [Zoogloea sp. LCSB751]